jgi:hypothetical protein
LSDILQAVSSPDAIEKYREANAEMERGAKTLGVGSLAWLLLENKIPDNQIPEFATRPEYGHLLNDFASMMSPDVAARLKSLAHEKNSQRLAESKRTADPEFLGNFLTAQLFLQIRFNIAEERFEQICADVPEIVRGMMPVWSFFYLSWLMRLAVRQRYGEEFEAEMMRAAYGRLMNAPREVSDLATQTARYIRYWFDEFDRRFEDFRDKGPVQVAGHEIPFEWGVAMSLLMLDSGSAYFLDRSKIQHADDPRAQEALAKINRDEADTAVGDALIKLKGEAIKFITHAVEIGKALG